MIIADENNQVFLSWVAAWIDTEGYIGLRVASVKNQITPAYRPLVGISQKDIRPLEIIQSIFHGHITHTKKTSEVHQLIFHSAQAVRLIKCVRQYILVKERQADLIIEAGGLTAKSLGYNRYKPKPQSVLDRLEKIKLALHELNGWSNERRLASSKRSKKYWKIHKATWARKYKSCIECGRNNIKHAAGGLCYACYSRNRYRPGENIAKR